MQPQILSGGDPTVTAPLLPADLHATAAVFDNHLDAEKAVRSLQLAGFDMKKLSIVGKEYQTEQDVIGFYNTGDRMKAWGKTGAFWGGLWGLLFGSAFFLVPGIGPLLAAGPLVAWIVGALEGAVVVGGLSALGAGLYGIGIPKDSVIEYEAQVRAGKFVVIAHGTAAEVRDITAALEASDHHGLRDYACSSAALIGSDLKSEYVRRDTILKLLTDQEAASVSTAESAPSLAVGELYLDLEHLDHGVQRAGDAALPMGQVLPRKAVSEATWNRIVSQLVTASA